MKRYELGLGRDYVSDWDVWAGVREFIQNAIDQETTIKDNKMEVEYDNANEILRITNKSSVLEHHTLILGNTSKSDDENTIGMFGEGYKIAMLVLTRLGKNVVIYNYGKREIWNIHFSKLKKYDYVETLVVDIETKAIWSRIPDKNLTIEISGITSDEYEVIKDNMLLNKDYIYYPTTYGNILEDEEYSGNLYVNGLKICHMENFKYGYDIKPKYLKIGRDRNLVDSTSLYRITRKMWLLSKRTEDMKVLMKTDYDDCSNMSMEIDGWEITYETRTEALKLAESTFKDYKAKYGEDVIITTSENERRSFQHQYENANVVVLDSKIGRLLKFSSQFEENFKNLKIKEMTLQEKILEWGNSHYVDNRSMDELFDILAPMIETYSNVTGNKFYGNDKEQDIA